jgi:ABC-type dipeptide/oligopeptide/nickel transport system ATPase component
MIATGAGFNPSSIRHHSCSPKFLLAACKLGGGGSQVNEHSTFQRAVAYSTQHRYYRLLLPILVLFASTDIWKIGKGASTLAFLTGGLGLAVLAYAVYRLRKATLLGPEQCKYFFPFLAMIDEPTQARFLLSRASLLEQLGLAVRGSVASHVIVVGPSGVGKSTLLQQYVAAVKDKRHILTDPIGYVDDALGAIVGTERIRSDKIFEEDRAIINGDNSSLNAMRQAMLRTIERCVDNAVDPFVIIFDQAERLAVYLETATDQERMRLASFLAVCRSTGVRVVFAVRSEYLADIVSLMPKDGYSLFFVDEDNPESDLRQRLERLNFAKNEIDDYIPIVRSKGKINTFVYQLAGYLAESVGLHEILRNRHKYFSDERAIIEVYIEKLLDDYGYLHCDHMRAADVEVVLFTISNFNKRTGRAIEFDAIGRIAHLPYGRLQKCGDYLFQKKVIGDPADKVSGIRIAHDVLMDQILNREARFLQAERRLAIEQIIDRGFERGDLVDTLDEMHPLYPPYCFRQTADGKTEMGGALETVLLWSAAILYWWRIAFPDAAAEVLAPVNHYLNHLIPDIVVAPQDSNVFFVLIAFTQYIWVIFIYGLNKGFFYYLHKVGELNGFTYFALQIAGPAGALMGFILSFAPALFIIPIAVPGLGLALVYLCLYRRRDRETAIYKMFWEFGITTVGNMIIAFGACYLLYKTVRHHSGDGYASNVLVIYFVCALFLYFAYHMRHRQGSEIGRNGMLAMYDAGRRRG